MVAIAQLVEHWIVIPGVAGSIPVGHPIKKDLLSRNSKEVFLFQALTIQALSSEDTPKMVLRA
jgi:hypothetical protein